jgi:predicted KAP-like P-loop ATPase
MKYKLAPIEIPTDDPFQFDALDRRPSVEALSLLIDELQGPFVLAIDSPWGTGKTIFVQLLQSVLKGKGFTCLYFNSWETDFSTDPMVAFLGELGKLVANDIKKESGFTKHFQKAKKIATLLAKKAIPVAGKVVTAGVLDLESFTEKTIADYVSSSISDAVDAYAAERSLIDEFHTSLSQAIAKLNEEGKKPQVIIFVDELDRCRPTYAVDLLERIKHLFNINNVIFVISLDKQQLHVSLGAVYGRDINSEEYLRRFIDLEYWHAPGSVDTALN